MLKTIVIKKDLVRFFKFLTKHTLKYYPQKLEIEKDDEGSCTGYVFHNEYGCFKVTIYASTKIAYMEFW
jgi:hypothetical protein